MGLESGTYIDSLVSTNPTGSDVRSQGDDHLRLIKATVKASFPDVDEAVVTIHNGTSAPSTPQIGTVWRDTTNSLWKFYNGSSWLVLPLAFNATSNLNISGNALISTDTNGDITVTPNGTGEIVLDGQKWPQADGDNTDYLTTNGSGQIAWTENTVPASETAAAASAATATAQAVIATAKAVLTASDSVDTAADAVSTAADVVSATAATGAVAFKFTFDNSTSMADPGTGEIRFDHGTIASVTNFAFDAVTADAGNPDISDLIASIDDGTNSVHEGYIFIRKSGTLATYAAFNVTGAVTDNTGWLNVPVTHSSSNGTISNGDSLYISFVRSGNVGATGSAATIAVGSVTPSTVGVGGSATAAVSNSGSSSSATFDFAFGLPTGATGATGASSSGFHYQFATATADSDQGQGRIWLNHATVASATVLYIDDDDNDGTDISAFTATWDDSSATADKGFIKIQARATPTDYAVFKISSGGTDNTAYWEFPVSHLVSAGTLSNTEVVDVFFTRSGDSGGVANRTVDTMVGTGSDATLSLSQSPGSTNNCTCFIDGVGQHPGTDFNISGSVLTFTTAPALSTVVVAICGGNESIGTPSDNTVTSAKIVNGAILDADVNASAAIATSKLSGAVTSIASHGLGALASLATVGNSQIDNNAVDEDKLKDALIADFTEVTVATGDSILLGDATDSGNTKRDTVQGILDLVPSAGWTLVAEQATTSGSTITFGSIPAGTKVIAVILDQVSTNGTGKAISVRIGDEDGVETSGYIGGSGQMLLSANAAVSDGDEWNLIGDGSVAANNYSGVCTLRLQQASSFTWSQSGSLSANTGGHAAVSAGSKTLDKELTQVQLKSHNTFDGGAVSIQYMS